MSDARTIHLRITGRVQGVGYRAWLAATARQLKLAGWVRNRRDGTVEAAVRGTPVDVDRLIAACRIGPLAASVTAVELGEAPAGALAEPFEVRPTA